MILINRVQEYRNKQGYTQFELAEVSKVSFNTIQKLESAKGINSDAYVSVALKLAKALGTTVEELFKYDKEKVMNTKYEAMSKEYGTITFGGREYALINQAEFEYRSHNSNGFQLTEPNNWMSAVAIDTNENKYAIWWYIDDEHINDEDMSDVCDWENPNEVIAIKD